MKKEEEENKKRKERERKSREIRTQIRWEQSDTYMYMCSRYMHMYEVEVSMNPNLELIKAKEVSAGGNIPGHWCYGVISMRFLTTWGTWQGLLETVYPCRDGRRKLRNGTNMREVCGGRGVKERRKEGEKEREKKEREERRRKRIYGYMLKERGSGNWRWN